MPGTVRFVTVSKDPIFCKVIRDGLNTFTNIEMVVSVPSQQQAENKISRTISTIMLFDLDSVPVEPDFISRMVARFKNVLVIYTAIKEVKASLLTKEIMPDFIKKPIPVTAIGVKKYLNLILIRMMGLASSVNRNINYKGVAKTITAGDKVIAIASSTGGVEALETILAKLPVDVPPIILVQHMPSGFTKLYAERLNGKYPLEIKEAETGDFLMQGRMLIAPADNHMQLARHGHNFTVQCFLGPKMHGVIPAADILFKSVADLIKKDAIGIVLTGMGADGARGLMLMHNNGAKTIIQDEKTCVVYGMPKAAFETGAIDYVEPLNHIADRIIEIVNKKMNR